MWFSSLGRRCSLQNHAGGGAPAWRESGDTPFLPTRASSLIPRITTRNNENHAAKRGRHRDKLNSNMMMWRVHRWDEQGQSVVLPHVPMNRNASVYIICDMSYYVRFAACQPHHQKGATKRAMGRAGLLKLKVHTWPDFHVDRQIDRATDRATWSNRGLVRTDGRLQLLRDER